MCSSSVHAEIGTHVFGKQTQRGIAPFDGNFWVVPSGVAAFAEDSEPVRSTVGSKCLRCRFSDGNVLTVGAKQLCCTEVLFRQSLPMSDVPAGRLTRMPVSSSRDGSACSVMKCDVCIRKELYPECCVVAGTATSFTIVMKCDVDFRK